jgi:hypothetical protein
MSKLEKHIVKDILDWLNSHPVCFAAKIHQNQFSKGLPDIIGTMTGRTLALEVKRPGRKATKLQAAVLRKFEDAGAITAVVTSVDDVREVIEDESSHRTTANVS